MCSSRLRDVQRFCQKFQQIKHNLHMYFMNCTTHIIRIFTHVKLSYFLVDLVTLESDNFYRVFCEITVQI